MKQSLLSALFLPSVLLTSVTVNNNVNVSTDTSGGGSSYTSIQTTNNGKTTKVESNESGEIHVESKNGETKVETSPGMKVNITESGSVKGESSSTPSSNTNNSGSTTESRPDDKEIKLSPTVKFWTEIKTVWENFLKTFHLFRAF